MIYNWGYKLGCLNIVAGIGIGALGGHKPWPQERKDLYDRSLVFHFLSGIGIIIASQPTVSKIAIGLLQNGVICFCFPIFHKAFTGERTWASRLPPIGGMSMILGWLLLALRK